MTAQLPSTGPLAQAAILPSVGVNGTASSFVTATASQFHLLYVPDRIGGHQVTNAGLDIRTLSFPNTHRAVTVHYYEIVTT